MRKANLEDKLINSEMQELFGKEKKYENVEPSKSHEVEGFSVQQLVERAIKLLQENAPEEGYYLAFSGGKDSCAIKKLAQMAGVAFKAYYNLTTMDAPELMHFMRTEHPDIIFNKPQMPMMHRIATALKTPPTRMGRWCCSEYKEAYGKGHTKIFGVRAAESANRKKTWREISKDNHDDIAICPIVYWSDEQLWEFIRTYDVKYCSLYDEGFKRLGCIGCPLSSIKNQDIEFKRWPGFERAWKRAIIKNWEFNKDVPNTRTRKPRYHAKYRSGEDFWKWWRTAKAPDYVKGDCQGEQLYTNVEGATDAELDALKEEK